MKKSKFLAWMMAIALVMAPGASAYAEDTAPKPTTPPADTTTPPPADEDDDAGSVCPEFPSDDEDEEEDDDDQDEADDTDKGDDSVDEGSDGEKDDATAPAPQASDRDGGKNSDKNSGKKEKDKSADKDREKEKDKDDAKDSDKDGDEDKDDDDRSDCYKHDNGKHKGWSKKIENMVKRIEELKKQAEDLKNQLERLKDWAKANGSTNDLDALKQILDALAAKDDAGEADTDDLLVLAETQDQLSDTASSVQTLEKALATDYANDEVYKLLGQKLVKKGEKGIKIYVKGKKPQFDVQPVVVGGRTLVPLRAIGDALDAEVKWDEATKTITLIGKDGKVVTLQLNNNKATVDGKTVTLDVPATTVNGRTLVPLRALGDFFDLEVGWDSSTGMAVLK